MLIDKLPRERTDSIPFCDGKPGQWMNLMEKRFPSRFYLVDTTVVAMPVDQYFALALGRGRDIG